MIAHHDKSQRFRISYDNDRTIPTRRKYKFCIDRRGLGYFIDRSERKLVRSRCKSEHGVRTTGIVVA